MRPASLGSGCSPSLCKCRDISPSGNASVSAEDLPCHGLEEATALAPRSLAGKTY